MRYRQLDANGDYTFGKGQENFFIDDPEGVAQLVKTRLKLIQGEYFLDSQEGVPYNTKILGAGKIMTYDSAIQDVILNTQGVLKISDYLSWVDPITRKASVSCTLDTVYGSTTL